MSTSASRVASRYLTKEAADPKTITLGYGRMGGEVGMPEDWATELSAAYPRSFPMGRARKERQSGGTWLYWYKRSDKALDMARKWMKKNHPNVKFTSYLDYVTSPESETYWAS